MKAPAKQATWAGVAMLALTILSSYISIKYERHQVAKSQEAAPVKVDVKVEGGNDHSHGEVLSRIDIETLIRAALEAQRKLDLETFKQLEEWERK